MARQQQQSVIHVPGRQQALPDSTVHWLPVRTPKDFTAADAEQVLFSRSRDLPAPAAAEAFVVPGGQQQGDGAAARPATDADTPAPCGAPASATPSPPLTASLRGRHLNGCTLPLPPGFRGFVMQLQQQSGDAEGPGDDDMIMDEDGVGRQPARAWRAAHEFSSVTYWLHDAAPGRADPQRRALDWLALSCKVHAPVTLDQVRAKMQDMASSAAS